MVACSSHQAWLFYSPLARQAALLKDDLLDPVDQLLDDPALVDLVRQCLAKRSPCSTRTGRTGMAPDRLLRCSVMKHLKGWSFRDLERELRSNLVYRRFTHFDADTTPDFSVFSRSFALLTPAVTAEIHQRVVSLACEQGAAQGQKLRTDTTAVESNVHYPTDSSLLGDGIRVLSRSLQGIAHECKNGALAVVDHGRAVKHRLLEIGRAAKCLTEANQERMQDSYQKLLALTRGVVRQAIAVVQRWTKGRLKVVGKLPRVETQIGQLRHFLPLVENVIRQTKERVLHGNSHVEEKVLSLFEPHTEVIRKGKAHKPNEFGRLVRIDEVENGIVSGYQVLTGNPADTKAWMPALQQHQAGFGRVPEMATADRGYFSAENEREAQAVGVKKVALPARGRLSAKRAEQQKQRWFRRALRWRAGCEATISTLKHPSSMARATYKGELGFVRYVGWCVITKTLFSIARYQERRRRHGQVG
ncbi:MAG TPA: ISNCY family transposase [Terriglobales bacterium]|nr:ISNCY family transposase [Terriglobales bacterium]